jgi:hypothetical protein
MSGEFLRIVAEGMALYVLMAMSLKYIGFSRILQDIFLQRLEC